MTGLSDDEPVASPCVHVCCLDLATDLCIGCFRNRDELARWPTLSALEKRRVLHLVAARRAAASDGDLADAE
ncbi:MAG: DUF1289 domain-containing protein [Gemmatimonas sp.]